MADFAGIPTSDSDATVKIGSYLRGYNKKAVVTANIAWTLGETLAGVGSTAEVARLTRAAIEDYDPDAAFTYSEVTDDAVAIVMNQYRKFSKQIDQTRINAGAGSYLAKVLVGAGFDMAYNIDQYVSAEVLAASGTIDLGAVDATAANACYNLIGDAVEQLPETGFQTVGFLPKHYFNHLVRDTRVVAPGQAETHGGRVVEILGVKVVETNAAGALAGWFTNDPNSVMGGTSLSMIDTSFRTGPFKVGVAGITVFGASVVEAGSIAKVAFASGS